MPKSGTTTERGYGARHQAARKRWEPKVRAGKVVCWRCRRRIDPREPWDLGHDDRDRRVYRGPEHRDCNRRAGAVKGNKSPKRRRIRRTVLRW